MATAEKIFEIDRLTHFIGGMVERFRPICIALGDSETQLLRSNLADIIIDRPVYITGLARAGTTILLELLAGLDGVVSHRYRDYPGLFIPFFWNWFLDRTGAKQQNHKERAHRDGIYVTRESPEAMEEPLWLAFFAARYGYDSSEQLDRDVEHHAFETFYQDHIRKLLLIRGGTRYVAKGNYNVTRLPYLQKLFHDARFILAVRQPQAHIASLIKQHRLFCRGEDEEPRARAHLRRVGHFEFGHNRRAIHTGDDNIWRSVEELWQYGDEVRAWARYWAAIYGYVHQLLASDEKLRQAVRIVRYEDLCANPAAAMLDVLAHCALPTSNAFLAQLQQRIKPPTYYQPTFSPEDLDIITQETQEVAQKFGYDSHRF